MINVSTTNDIIINLRKADCAGWVKEKRCMNEILTGSEANICSKHDDDIH